MRKIWDIHGGVHPPENKLQSSGEPIARIPLAEQLILPLTQHVGAPAIPVVKVGDRVLKGQLIADAQGVFSATLHASTSGTIVAIEDRPVMHPSGMSAPCIVIASDGEDRWTELHECEDYSALPHTELVDKIRRAGLAGLGGAGFPTAIKLDPRRADLIDTLILNGTECEPYITADDRLMRECADEVIQGSLLLARILGHPQTILVGIEDNKPEAIAAMQKAAQNTPVEIVVFPTKYPSGGEKQLIQILSGKEVPSGKLPAELGIVVQNVGTAQAAWRAVRYGEPLVERITTVVGEALKIQRNIRVPLGTPIGHILQHHGFVPHTGERLIIGGPMMGYTVDKLAAPVSKTTNCILAPSLTEMPAPPPAQACIRCGMCAEACPANLLPQQLYWYAQAEDHEKLLNHHLMDCIECGACSYICPSAIPLVQYYRASKADIRHQEAERIKSDRARERFEQRQARLAKQEAEKEAKRLARKKAAEEAKKQLAEQTPTDGNAAKSDTDSITRKHNSSRADHVANEAKTLDPEVQRKKLARALSSAQSRVDRVKKQIDEADSPDRADTLLAQLKQAQVKADDAQKKLDAFDKGATTPLQDKLQSVENRTQASPREAQQKAIETIKKRLAVAQEKVAEAEKEGKPTLDALRQGVAKLQSKLEDAERELINLEASDGKASDTESAPDKQSDAASEAIARAKAKADAQSAMSSDEKRRMQIDSLIGRIDKARSKLQTAEAENSEHLPALRTALQKLESKLSELRDDQD